MASALTTMQISTRTVSYTHLFSTPDTVGKIGDFEVTSGLYLLAQYDAYQQAAQLADSEQDTSKVKSFLMG